MRPLEVLHKSIETNKLGHAILLESKNCKTLSETAESLASKILKTDVLHSHPDFFTLRPSGKSRFIRIGKKEDRNKGNLPENTMRRLIDDLQKTSNQGGHKVAIIYEAERMNKESANAFLKTLEEPPLDTILFHRPYDLIDTIKSRCLTYRIPADTVLETNELWESWKHSYWQWMSSLIQGYDRSKLGHLFFGFYGMVIKLQSTIENYRESVLVSEEEKVHRVLTDDEKTAMQTGIERTVREQLFSQIADLNNDFVKETAKQNDQKYLVFALDEIMKALEKSLSLLQLNFNASSASELYFLKSLRVWSKATKDYY